MGAPWSFFVSSLARPGSGAEGQRALVQALADRVPDRLFDAIAGEHATTKVVAYLSAEFLTGPHLGNSLINVGMWDAAAEAVSRFGQHLPALLAEEEEPGLGNGGLGRLAACYMDSLATLDIPAIGYGIRYEFGIFDQAIRDGWQVELTDKWLRLGHAWEIAHNPAWPIDADGHVSFAA